MTVSSALRNLVIIIALSWAGAFITPSASAENDLYGVPRVVDGDTLVVHGKRIRVHGIDAPESSQQCQSDAGLWNCGTEATQALKDFIKGQAVRCLAQDTDRYGRIIARCFARGSGGDDVGRRMVREGWALSYRQYSRDYVDEERIAQAQRRGIWRGKFVKPWDWRRGERLAPKLTIERPLIPELKKTPTTAGACCKICRKGKACGNSCISHSKNCTRPVGCACNGY